MGGGGGFRGRAGSYHPCDNSYSVKGRGFDCLLREAIAVLLSLCLLTLVLVLHYSSREEVGLPVQCALFHRTVGNTTYYILLVSGHDLVRVWIIIGAATPAVYFCLLVGDFVEHGQTRYLASLFKGWPAQ